MPLGSYTPIKATIFNTNFELGVTRNHHIERSIDGSKTTNAPPSTNQLNSSTSSVKYQAPPPPPPPRTKSSSSSSAALTNGITIAATKQQQQRPHQQTLNVNKQIEPLIQHSDGPPSSNGIDQDSLQYLKPASDEQTVAWSEGASDLLF